MMNFIWAGLCFAGLVWGMLHGKSAALSQAAFQAMQDAVQLAIKLAGGFALWSGMLQIVEESGVIHAATRKLAPVMDKLFKGLSQKHPAKEAMAMNMAANMLGLGNAATPMGVRAMHLLGEDNANGAATDAMCMFLVINASSLQLFPSTVIALRGAAGSFAPASIVMPTLISTAVSTVVGVAACAWMASIGRKSHA